GLSRIKTNQPPAVFFWYRESPRYLVSPTGGYITRSQPNKFERGMLEVLLDSEGLLIEFHAQPPEEAPAQGRMRTADWHSLFVVAGLDHARFTPTEPVLTPETACESRAAWTGPWDHARHDTIRVEAAAYQGRPVFFRIAGPWTRPTQPAPPQLGGFTFSTFL